MQHLLPNTLLQGGKYIIKRVLGQGGFGITYLAEQVSLGREVAIKEFFMKDNCVRDGETGEVKVPTTGSAAQVEQYRKKFLKEARTMASLDHPNIVRVMEVFEQNGTVYYSMPYLPGGSLKEWVLSYGKMPEGQALHYICQIAEALKYLHEQKHLCHYDVKPANILLDRNDNAVLIDFGISKNYDSNGHETSTTPIGMSDGFAPIEQYHQMVVNYSPKSDVYALGATLYFLLTGMTPPSAVERVQGDDLSFDSDISAQTCELIRRAMKLAIKDRLQNVEAFINLQDDTIIHPSTPTDIDTPNIQKGGPDSQRKYRLNWQIIATEVIVAFIISILWFFMGWVCGYPWYIQPSHYPLDHIYNLIVGGMAMAIGGVALLILKSISKESVSKNIVVPELCLFMLIGWIIWFNGYYSIKEPLINLVSLMLVAVYTVLVSLWDNRVPKKLFFPVLLVFFGIGCAFVTIIWWLNGGHKQEITVYDLFIADSICILLVLILSIICHKWQQS